MTLIFSLYRTDQRASSRALLLRGSFITLLREIEAFDAEALADHLNLHFSGPFVPYTLSMREHFKRLLALTYQVDVYLALAHKKPSVLHLQEMGSHFMSTYAAWNAHGLDVFARRLREEPSGRAAVQISALTDGPGSFYSSPLLVEDALLGLCGTLQTAWVLTQPSPSKMRRPQPTKALQKALLIETLDAWKQELQKMKRLVDSRTSDSDAVKSLLLAYRGKDDSVMAALGRINILLADGMDLYYMLKMQHYTGLGSFEFVSLVKQKSRPTEIWRTTKTGREVLECALQMLERVDSARSSSNRASTNPLSQYALVMAANLTRRVLVSCENCECSTEQQGQGRATEAGIGQWIETGGPLCVGGTMLCLCKLDVWMAKFDEAIRNQRLMTEDIVGSDSS